MPETKKDSNTSKPKIESELRPETSLLFDPAKPEQQIGACSQLVHDLIMEELLASGDKNDGMRKLLDLLHKVQSSPLAQEEGIAQQLVESTVTVLDLLGVDLISQRIQGLRFKYQRQLGTSSVWNNMSLSGKYQGDRDWMTN